MAKSKSEKEIKSIYFIGIKGMAMSGLALMAKQLGYEVNGSDVAEVFQSDQFLVKNKINFYNNFDAVHIEEVNPDIVAFSAVYGMENPEMKEAKKRRIKMLCQSEMLASFIEQFEVIGVSGVHGKTTTTSMLAFIFKDAGYSPGYMIGAPDIPGLDGSAHIGEGRYFIVEADEYKKSQDILEPKFLDYPMKNVIITSIELDHPDLYGSAEDVYQAFYKLSAKIPRDGLIVACNDWPLVRRLVTRRADRKSFTYGFKPGANYQIVDYKEGQTTDFVLKTDEENSEIITINLPGKHNALNAAASYIMAKKLGIPETSIIRALKKFEGPNRRFQILGKFKDTIVVDDFAHHPTAVASVIEAAKSKYPNKKINVVFQPHTYSRTGKFLNEFAASLSSADKVILVNIFASAREKSGYVTIKDLIIEVKKTKPDVEFRPNLEETAKYLANTLGSDDLLLLIGAGDVYKIYGLLKEIE